MKKILLYTDTPIVGGAEKQMLLLAKFLNKNNYSPTLCSSNFPQLNKWQEEFIKEGIPVIRLNVAHKHDPRHFFRLLKILPKFDLLHCHIWNPASCRYALLAAKLTKTPVITTEHDPFALLGLKNLIKKWQLQTVKKIICISKANQELLGQLYPAQKQKIVLVHNGIDTGKLEKELHLASHSIKYKKEVFMASKTTKIITCIAALHTRKGINFLLEAFSKLPPKFKDTKLILLGQGPDEAKFKQQAKNLKITNNSLFLGQRNDIPQILKNSDYFVLPSKREAFGLVLLEAMCAKIPILATNTGGIPDIIPSEKYALLAEPGNSSKLLQQLIKLLELSPHEITEMTNSSYNRVRKEFDVKIMADKTEKVYDQVVKK